MTPDDAVMVDAMLEAGAKMETFQNGLSRMRGEWRSWVPIDHWRTVDFGVTNIYLDAAHDLWGHQLPSRLPVHDMYFEELTG